MEANLKELNQKRAEFLCPFRPGDTLINTNGKKAVISAIIPSWGLPIIRGKIIRKDGKPSEIVRELWGREWKGSRKIE